MELIIVTEQPFPFARVHTRAAFLYQHLDAVAERKPVFTEEVRASVNLVSVLLPLRVHFVRFALSGRDGFGTQVIEIVVIRMNVMRKGVFLMLLIHAAGGAQVA